MRPSKENTELERLLKQLAQAAQRKDRKAENKLRAQVDAIFARREAAYSMKEKKEG